MLHTRLREYRGWRQNTGMYRYHNKIAKMRLRYLIHAAGYDTLAGFARYIGVDRSCLTYWLSYDRHISGYSQFRITTRLGLPDNYFLLTPTEYYRLKTIENVCRKVKRKFRERRLKSKSPHECTAGERQLAFIL